MDWTLGTAAIALLVIGLIGQGFELRRLRRGEEEYRLGNDKGGGGGGGGGAGSPSLFADRSNIKWYVIIGTGIILWYVAERV